MELNSIDRGLEEVPSKEIAYQKLEQIRAQDFSQFGIRFMNFEEYRKMLEAKTIEPKEVYWTGGKWPFSEIDMSEEEKRDPHNFTSFLKHAVRYWPGTSNVMTATGTLGSSAILGYTELLNLMKCCHGQAKQEAISDRTVRQRTMELFAEKIQKWFPYEGELHGLGKMRGQEKIKEDDNFDPKTQEAYSRLLEDPRHATKEEIRMIFDNSIRPYRESDSHADTFLGHDWEYSPYHLAVIFDRSAITNESSYYHDAWRYLKESADGKNVLGAISIISNKALITEMKKLSLNSGEWMHPLFNAHGTICFPKSEANNVKSSY